MIRLHKPTIKRKDMDAVLNCMVSEMVAPGEKNREFARLLKQQFQAVDVHVLRSYPKAVELALRACEARRAAASALSPGWYLFAAQSAGTELECCDVMPGFLAPDVQKIPEGCDVLLLHEPFGIFPDPQNYHDAGIPVIEDITQSFGSQKLESKPGEIGSILVMGLEEHDMITAGGGAVLIVRDRKYSEGLSRLISQEGDLMLMPDMNAALGIVQLSLYEEHMKRRREFFELFYKSLLKTRHHSVIELDEQNLSNCITFPVLLDSNSKAVLKFTRKYKVEAALAFEGCLLHAMEHETENFPNAMPYLLRTMLFPLYPLLSQDQIKTLVRVLAALP